MANGVGIDVANNTVIIRGESLIRSLFSGVASCTLDYFSKVAYGIVQAKAEEYGIEDIGEESDWHLGTTNDSDTKLLMSYLDETTRDMVETNPTTYGEKLDDQTHPVKAEEPKKWLH